MTTPGTLVHEVMSVPPVHHILETNYNNATAALSLTKSSPTWASDLVHGKTFMSGDDPANEWTQALAPTEDYEVELIGLSGWAVTPNLSGGDNPFLHPFCTHPAAPGKWDFEFFIAPDPQYQYLAAPAPTTTSGIASHSEYNAAAYEALRTLGVAVPAVVGMETDQNLAPLGYRPLHGDRVCVWGRWIVDTGHDDFHTEIHPALLIVAARPYVIAGAPANSKPDATLTTITGRPFLVSQKFGEGGFYAHMYEEAKKVAEFRSQKIEAHPTILPKPFNGTFLVSYTIRPPQPRSHPADVLFVKYKLTVRTGVVVQLTDSGDSVTVYLVMNSNQYQPPQLPPKYDANFTLDQLVKLNNSVAQVYQNPTFKDLDNYDLYFREVVGSGIKTDTYGIPQGSLHDPQFTRVPVTTLAGNTPILVDDSQPFPIYGSVDVEWQRQVITLETEQAKTG